MVYFEEPFTTDEQQVLGRFFTNVDLPVYALINLPEVVKGALFARYSRSPKSVRRLFLDEFINKPEDGIQAIADDETGPDASNAALKLARAEKLYDRVFSEYGDDSVAQLGGAHLACEQASNILTKILERGRMASYLEQSTRYIYYDQRLGRDYRFFVPEEVTAAGLEQRYRQVMNDLFLTYSEMVAVLVPYYQQRYPQSANDSDFIYKSTIRAKACDTIRGLLPASTTSNLGIFASGQAYESLLLRMRGSELSEPRDYADLMLTELRKVIPSFLKRVDIPDRGGAWSDYLASVRESMATSAAELETEILDSPEVILTDWDRDAEMEIIAGALYPESDASDIAIKQAVEKLSADEKATIFRGLVGDRNNRRHRPGRGFERAYYKFDLQTDFGIFRDLQRHRMLTIDWQKLTTGHGYVTSNVLADAGIADKWHETMGRAAELVEEITTACGARVAQYAVPFAFKIRYSMQMNAREAMHMLELRTAQGGHVDYRRVCQEMHCQIRERAGHRLIADSMKYVDYNDYDLDRLETERRAEIRRAAANASPSESSAD
jgi:thymidylate synthase ThyX